jgi:predicted 3-demethylubiquinone-9 3-methyltransferase (glyoxalase superfamily)
MVSSDDRAAADRAMRAMMGMKKIDVKKLEDAYAGK